jgi:hypothetical protein
MTIRHVGLFLVWLMTSMLAPDHAKSNSNPTAADVGGVFVADSHGDVVVTSSGAAGPIAEMVQATTARYSIAEQAVVTESDGLEKGDGFSSAPVCAIQHPLLLGRYRVRPHWRVAGVDYCVGHAMSTVLKDPATLSMAGVSVDTTKHVITVTGNNITLDGYDFSLNGGWGVVVQGANTKILNSNFFVGANSNKPILAAVSSSNLSVAFSTIDGHNDGNVSGLIENRGSGTLDVRYSWLKNAGGDIIQMHNGGQAAGVVIEYNLIQNAGMAPGAHGDYTEFLDGPFTAIIKFNTTTQDGGTTQGFMVEPDIGSRPGTIVSGEIGNNTFTSKGGLNTFTGVTVADIVNSFTVHDNYFDPTATLSGLSIGGVRGGPNDSSPKSSYVHNVNMVTGAILQDAKAATKTPRR